MQFERSKLVLFILGTFFAATLGVMAFSYEAYTRVYFRLNDAGT